MKFKGGRTGTIHVKSDEGEADLFRGLLGEMQILLEADIPPADPVVERLFPRAYQDEEQERAYRDLIGDDLTSAKLETLRSVRDSVGEMGPLDVDLGPDEVEAWLRLLTDLRLAIGVRLDVTEETMDATVDPDDPEAPAYSVLHWLGWIQGSILERMVR